jgi:DNA-binding response OmpR family regulator
MIRAADPPAVNFVVDAPFLQNFYGLSPQEARLLRLLLDHYGRVVTYETIEARLFAGVSEGNGYYARYYRPFRKLVSTLRAKFGGERIVTVRAVGIYLE